MTWCRACLPAGRVTKEYFQLKLSDFDYLLPKELIAQSPLKERSSSRLMVVERGGNAVYHRTFKDLSGYLEGGDLLVLNDTKVIKARLLGVKKGTGGRVDVLLSRRVSAKRFQALIRPRIRIGQEAVFGLGGAVSARLIEEGVLEFNRDISLKILERIGVMPLPPYIKRPPEAADNSVYQTVYARRPGAVASPTAGLHFDKDMIAWIKKKKARLNYITLHVGLGTFRPVKSEDIESHVMDPEEFNIPAPTMKSLLKVKKEGKRVFAVGTTTARALETAASLACLPDRQGPPAAGHSGKTDLFIYPGYRFKAVDCLLTNFHLPKTTLFMLVCAFAGRQLLMRAYQEAIKERYRFYSYGDAMLII